MAERKTVYPMLPVNHWWSLREKFKQSIPGTVTANYLATVLNMKEVSARSNVLPFIQQLGITDDEGKTLDRAREWRDDTMYPDVCATMVKELYPPELLEAVPDPASDRAAAERWFSNKTGSGATAVKRMTLFFSVLIDANPENKPGSKTVRRKSTTSTSRPQKMAASGATKTEPRQRREEQDGDDTPSVHINLQIHVSSDATPDQIDKIFESMATHIYRRG